jgi:XTP/dITP diphosphohydrolase
MKLVMATGNRHKLADVRAIVAGMPIEVVALSELGIRGEIVEDQPTFEGNARKKAEEASQLTGWPALGDDSGLEVAALDGAPGVRSARYAGEPCDDARNNEKLVAALAEVAPPRRARFRCFLALARPGAPTIVEAGVCDGEIGQTPRGAGGFGYDPLFVLPSGKTMAELPPDEKNRISHRARAMAAMRPHLAALVAR